MSTPPISAPPPLPQPANDNRRRSKPLRVIMNVPQSQPVQLVEVEVFASLIDDLSTLVANDNPEPEQ